MHMTSSMRAQCCQHIGIVNTTNKANLFTGECQQTALVFCDRLDIPNDDQWPFELALKVAFYDFDKVVFWFRAGNDEHVTLCDQTPTGKQGSWVASRFNDRCTISNKTAGHTERVIALKAIGNGLRISQDTRRSPGRHPLHGSQIGAGHHPPFAARPFKPIHVDPDFLSPDFSRPPACPSSTVTQHVNQVVSATGIGQTTAVVTDDGCRPPFGALDVSDPDALMPCVWQIGPFGLCIHGDVMTALHKANRQLFGKCFESAICSRNAASAKQRNFKSLSQLGYWRCGIGLGQI